MLNIIFVAIKIAAKNRRREYSIFSNGYLRSERAETVDLYFAKSVFSRYFKRRLRRPTICIRPRLAM